MLGQAKPFASLSSTLLARKGQARPAMRPQGFASLAPSPERLDDLGWNDMGSETSAPTPIAPAVAPAIEPAAPPVVAQQEALREEFESPVAPAAAEAPGVVQSVSVATASRLQRETAHKGRAAFTLRLDADRHLRLRLASALAHRSAQQLVAHALDRFLTTLPEVEALVAQLPPTPSPKGKR
ncbi:hypothetical protein [uncultured Sphingomonas sp.]|uniref:hypothetical protein n=1 Tax=uncultured Sphingomonas sp. TaxID=158754 RepID=UPI0035CC9729